MQDSPTDDLPRRKTATGVPLRVGFFGGTFDPPHNGHLALARMARELLRLDRVLIAPVASQPLKLDQQATPYQDRLAMTELAIAGEPGLELSTLDAPRPDGSPNYMIDTLGRLRAQMPASAQLFVLCGADAFLSIRQWHRPQDLLMDYPFVIGARPGFDLSRLAQALPEPLSVAAEENNQPGLLILGLREPRLQRAATAPRHSRLYLLPDLSNDISATELRAELDARPSLAGAKGGKPSDALSSAVLAYIRRHRLYQSRNTAAE